MLKPLLKVNTFRSLLSHISLCSFPSLCTEFVQQGVGRGRTTGAHTGGGFLAGPVTLAGAHTRTGCVWRTAHHGRVTYGCSTLGRSAARGMDSLWKTSWRTVSRGKDPTLRQRKDSSPWAAAGTRCDELITIPIPCLPALLGGGGRAGKNGVVEEGVFLRSHLLLIILLRFC